MHVLEGPDAQVKTVSVLVDVSQKQNKAYRGGYKDKRNGTLYHHADCQTDRQVSTAINLSCQCAMRGGELLLKQAEINSTALVESRTADDGFFPHTEKAIVMACWHTACWLNLLAANQSKSCQANRHPEGDLTPPQNNPCG